MLKIQTFKPENSYIKALIYWPSGAGKTTFSATAPKPIFASSEKGLMSIRHLQPQFAEINSLQDLKDLYNFLKNEKHDFETCVIDSITEINDIIKSEIEARNKRNMQLQDWGILQKEIKDILRKFRDLPMHIIFLAQETTERDEEKIVKYLPSLNGKSATEIAYYMDTVGYCFISKDGTRKVVTTPHANFLTKDRTNVIEWGENQNFSEWVEAMKTLTPNPSPKREGNAKQDPTPKTPTKTTTRKTTKTTEKITKASPKQAEDEGFVADSAKAENLEKIEEQKQALEEVFGNDEEQNNEVSTAQKMATQYQISTIVGFVKKLAWTIPYAEQKVKLKKTILAVLGVEVDGEGLEEMLAMLTISQCASLISYLQKKAQ